MIGGFSGEGLKWLAHVTVWLQVSDYSQLSDYTVGLQLCRLIRVKYTSLCTNHIWENCNIVMISIIIIYAGDVN